MRFGLGIRRWRSVGGVVLAIASVAGVVVLGAKQEQPVSQVRLHAGKVWVASGAVGRLTLLDGVTAEVAGSATVAAPGSDLRAAQQGATGYAVNRDADSVVRVDGATLRPSSPVRPLPGAGGRLAVFPAPGTLHALDLERGLLAGTDPVTLERTGPTHPLATRLTEDEPVVDPRGRLWTLDERTGELVWFADGRRHTLAGAGAPGSRLGMAGDRPVLADPARGRLALLDPRTGALQQSMPVDLRPGERPAVSGSPDGHRVLLAVPARGQLLSCAPETGSCDRVRLSGGPAELGKPVALGGHAVVPDHSSGRAWIVDLGAARVVAAPRLFDRPVRFELLTRDGMVFYNDPDSERAGVIGLDGRVRPITKYDPGEADRGGADRRPRQAMGPPAPAGEAPAVSGPGGTRPQPADSAAGTEVSIVIRPDSRGTVGEEFEFALVADGAATVRSARWTFGAGGRADGATVRHRWDRPGTYPVLAEAELSTGRRARAEAQVVVEAPDTPLRIDRLLLRPETPLAGAPVRFGAEVTGRARSWAWTVTGPRGRVTGSGAPRFEHIFDTPGSYVVHLRVSGPGGTDRRAQRFTVTRDRTEVRCGDVIDTATVAVLTTDLTCPGEVALTIAASHVELDLNGHTITTQHAADHGRGIVVAGEGTLTGITVRNGSVTRFRTGLDLVDVAEVTVADLGVTGPSAQTGRYAISGDRARDVRLSGVSVHGFQLFGFTGGSSAVFTESSLLGTRGTSLANCSRGSSCVIQRSTVELFSIGCFHGAQETDSSTVSVRESTVHIANLGPFCRAAAVSNSEISTLGSASAEHTDIVDNVLSGNWALDLSFSFNVSGNLFRNSAMRALILFSGQGTITGNTFTGTRGYGLLVSPSPTDPVGPVEISRNEFLGNGTPGEDGPGPDGLRVEQVHPDSLITVSDNRTRDNARYGINAEPGSVVDGGGNVSTADPAGCRGVRCH
ncbi:PKD domain-containing protein [Amycolatopsis aidingensis]|uniref:PKD domain-containing protein n=1 Tax=Amycolatopsis aidingensis TaxID=2842453 RepID=UPI001C0E596A|nr:PKD domain-containing protein [Amycolatopsis aidingensis]